MRKLLTHGLYIHQIVKKSLYRKKKKNNMPGIIGSKRVVFLCAVCRVCLPSCHPIPE